jgi:enoyl-CoA hydratase
VTYYALKYYVEGHVAVISLIVPMNSQQKVGNLAIELSELCSQICLDNDVRVFVFASANEKSFDIGEYRISDTMLRNRGLETTLLSFTAPVAQLNQPVIAAINGDALGQGLELALACDIRIATDTAHFGFPHIKEGLIPWDGGTQRLARVIGQAKAMEMILTGELIDAQEAYRIRLVSKVVPHDAVMTTAMEMAREMASKGPIALRYAKEAVYKGMDLTLDQGLRLEADLYFLLHTTKDRTEGIRAFQGKRKPEFEGK